MPKQSSLDPKILVKPFCQIFLLNSLIRFQIYFLENVPFTLSFVL
jgi:hypothetical protein